MFDSFRTPLLALLCSTNMVASHHAFSDVFEAHCRQRPPELLFSHGSCAGPVSDIVETALKNIGHDVRWVETPWVRSIRTAEYGKVDLLPMHSMNEARKQFLDAVVYGYQVRKIKFYLSPNFTGDIQTAEDLEQYKVGALKDSFYSERFNGNDRIKKAGFLTTEQLIQLLKAGRIDVAVTSSTHDLALFEKEKNLRLASYQDAFYNGRYISIPKSSPKHVYFSAFKQEIERMSREGEIGSIFKHYQLPDPTKKSLENE